VDQINIFFAFSILLDGLAHISAIFLLKMEKKVKNRLTLMHIPAYFHMDIRYIHCHHKWRLLTDNERQKQFTKLFVF
jgi:hypothetical protein